MTRKAPRIYRDNPHETNHMAAAFTGERQSSSSSSSFVKGSRVVAAATSLSPGFLTTASCALAAMLVTASHAQGASASPSLAFSSVPISNRSAECSAAISTSNDPLAVRFGCNPYGSHRRARGRGTASSCSSSGTSRKKRSESLLLRLMVPLSSSMSSYSSEDVFEAFGAFRDGMQVRGGATNFPGGGGGGREGKGGDNIIRRSATAGGVQEDGPFVLEGVKNIRDLGSIPNSGIVKGRVFRTGHLSDATAADTATLMDVTGLRTLVDLRSTKELERDELIQGQVYHGFVNVGGGGQPGKGGAIWEEKKKAFVEVEGGEARRRYFVSLIDESIYKKGVFQRLSRWHKAKVLALAPAAVVSRRCTKKARGIFLREINDGGLVLLNELLLQYSGEGITRVLRLLASPERHPVALYCTAGKDRTGLVMALTLSVLGVPEDAIVDDYAMSDAAYKELADRDAMVGALAQEELDPDTFSGAPRHVMEEVLRFIGAKYGSVNDYLDSVGFDAEWRDRLRSALLSKE